MKFLKLVKKHKIISITIILSTIFILCIIVFLTLTAITHEKDKKNRTFLDRDNTTIVCNKGEKIGNIKVRYQTNDNKDLQKYTIKLYCTDSPNLNDDYYSKVYSVVLGGFFYKFKNKLNLYNFNIEGWYSSLYFYSKEWDRKYTLSDNNFDGYFIT